MTTNRPPNVSSYYDGRDGRSSNDANQSLSAYQQNQSFPRRERVDSSSSSAANYSNNRLSQTSQDLLTGEMPGQQHLTGSGGYNRNSFFPPTSEAPVKGLDDLERQQHAALGPQDDGWDVYADFNNTGPRYSVALGGSTNSQGWVTYCPYSLLRTLIVLLNLKISSITCRSFQTRNSIIRGRQWSRRTRHRPRTRRRMAKVRAPSHDQIRKTRTTHG